MRSLVLGIAFALASLAAAAEEQPPALAVIGKYVEASSPIDPNLYRIILRNDGMAPVTIKYLSTVAEGESPRSIGANDPDVCWWRAMPPVLPPGGYAEIRIKMDHAGATLSAVRVQSAEGANVSLSLPTERPSLAIRSMHYDAREQSYVAYWSASNPSDAAPEVYLDGIRIMPIEITGKTVPDQLQCFAIKLKNPARIGGHHLLSLRAAKGSADCFFRVPAPFYAGIETTGLEVFSQKKIACDMNALIGSSSSKGAESARPGTCLIASCLTHKPAAPRANIWLMLRNQRKIWEKDAFQSTVVHLCRLDLEEGSAMFGQAADGIRVNPYPYEVPGSLVHDFNAARKILEEARIGAGTCGVHAVIPVESAKDNRILPRTLLAISAGCAGVLYRLPTHKDPEDLKQITSHIEAELQPVRDTLPLWDAVETLSSVHSTDSSIGGWLVQMGPRRLAVILVAATFTPLEKASVISFNLPPGTRARRVVGFDGKVVMSLRGDEKALELAVDRFRGGTVVFIELAKQDADGNGF